MTPEEIQNWQRPPVQSARIWLGVNDQGRIYEVFTEEAKALRWLENSTSAVTASLIDRENEWRARRLLWTVEVLPQDCRPVHYIPATPAHLETS